MAYNIGQTVKFKTDNGQTLEGTILDYTDIAVRISCIIGTFIVPPNNIILDPIHKNSVFNEYEDYFGSNSAWSWDED